VRVWRGYRAGDINNISNNPPLLFKGDDHDDGLSHIYNIKRLIGPYA